MGKTKHRDAAVLLALALAPPLLLAAIALKGRTYDPAWFTPPPAEDAIAADGPRLPETLAGWTLGGAEWFPAAEMYRKINGRAQFYEQFGTKGLLAGTWTRGAEQWDMFLYETPGAKAAEGVFLAEREDRAVAGSHQAAYAMPGLSVLRAGAFYMQLASLAADAPPEAVAELAAAIARHLPAAAGEDDAASGAVAELPSAGQVPGSAGLHAKDGFGYVSLVNARFARYAAGGSEATWFLADGERPAFSAYTNELRQFGGQQVFALPDAVGGEMFDAWELAGVVRGTLAGVRDAATRDELIAHWNALKQSLGEKP